MSDEIQITMMDFCLALKKMSSGMDGMQREKVEASLAAIAECLAHLPLRMRMGYLAEALYRTIIPPERRDPSNKVGVA